MKLPIEVSKQIYKDRATSLGYEAIVLDCAIGSKPLISEILLHCGEMSRQEIRGMNAAMEYWQRKMLTRYGLKEKGHD